MTSRSSLIYTALLCLGALVLQGLFANPAAAEMALREQLRQRLEIAGSDQALVAAGRELQAASLLQTLYQAREWRPIWFDDQGRPSALQAQLLGAVDRAGDHGLAPEHYHRPALEDLLSRALPGASVAQRADIELLASDGLLRLGYHLLHGRVDPETIDPDWWLQREVPDLFAALADVRGQGAVDLVAVLDGLAPGYPAYRLLRDQMAMKRSLASNGPWPLIESGPSLHPGMSDARVVVLRQRLIELGDLPVDADQADGPADEYDERLVEGVRAFQYRHGLEPDSVVGPRTLAELNVSPSERVAQLRANLERWRWLPRDLGEEYLLVNIAGYTMQVHSNGDTVMAQRVVVGTPARRTPVFTANMTYLVLNPSWEVPLRLAVQDQLPRIRADLGHLERLGMSVLQGWGADERRIDPASVDWGQLSARHFPYRLRQAPGPQNALGRVKFMFPNRHDVYLHDTPSRGLFAREERAFSSGCIRVEDPQTLIQWLLNQRSNIMPPERIQAILDSGVETTVRLDRPLPVHLLYWTAWVDEQGRVQYRRDIYQRDLPLIAALDTPPVHLQGM